MGVRVDFTTFSLQTEKKQTKKNPATKVISECALKMLNSLRNIIMMHIMVTVACTLMYSQGYIIKMHTPVAVTLP